MDRFKNMSKTKVQLLKVKYLFMLFKPHDKITR